MKSIKKYWIMVYELAFAEFRMRDQGTFFGFLWTLIYPMIYFFVLYSLFSKWMGSRISDFPLYLIIGIIQWNFFQTATTNAITIIFRYRDFVKNINFPKSSLVISSVMSVLFSHIFELIVLVIFWIVIKKHVTFMVLGLIPLLLLNIYLALSISFILAYIGVYFLDVSRIWAIFVNIGLFLTPIFYSLDIIAPEKRYIILLNPMTHIIKATRDILIENKFPDIGGLLYVFVLCNIIFIFSYRHFNKNEGYFVEKI